MSKEELVPSLVKTYKLENYELIKESLIHLINNDNNSLNREFPEIDVKIEKNDYHISHDFSREWVKKFYPHFEKKCLEFSKLLGFSNFNATAMWYQKYNSGDVHGWHHHGGCNYSGVFYVDNKDSICNTEFFNPITNKVFTMKLKEGEMCFFPSFIMHQSPKNFYNSQKTIISFNIDFLLFEEEYVKIDKKIKNIRRNSGN